VKEILRLLRLVRPFSGQVAAATGLGIATVASGVGLMGTAAFLIASAALQPSIAELQVAIVGVRFFGLARGIFRYLERLTSHQLTLRLLGHLRVWFYEALEPLAPARTLSMRSADLLTRAVADVESLQEFYIRVLAPPLVAVTVAAGTGFFLGTFDLSLGVVFLILVAAAGIGIPAGMRALGTPVGNRLATTRPDLGAAIVDGIQGMADLLACGQGAAHRHRVDELSSRLVRDRERASRIEALGAAAMTFATHATVWIVLVLAIPMVRAGLFDGVGLAVICLVAMAAFEAVQPLPAAALHLSEQLAAAKRVFTVLDARPAVEEPDRPAPVSGGLSPPAIQIRGLGFSYPGSNSPALAGLDLELPAGNRLAVVGPSGAGKTTLAQLLLRFWDPTDGEILLAGRPLPVYRLDHLRQVVGVLSQRIDLFTGTVRDNLLLASPGADAAALEEAAVHAELLGTIHALPEGWDTWIGEQGLELSGGQRQRLAIARVLLRDPALLVLDEPTTGLDPVTEMHLMQSLHRLMDGRTTILITHRLVAMDAMDQILVLDRGRVVELGSHDQLLKLGGLYRQLYEAQQLTMNSEFGIRKPPAAGQ
jgi:thiol reductant ABC exporter CydC subunit